MRTHLTQLVSLRHWGVYPLSFPSSSIPVFLSLSRAHPLKPAMGDGRPQNFAAKRFRCILRSKTTRVSNSRISISNKMTLIPQLCSLEANYTSHKIDQIFRTPQPNFFGCPDRYPRHPKWLRLRSQMLLGVTSFWTIDGRWARSILTVWNMSTTPS